MQRSMFSSEEPPASPSRWRDFARALLAETGELPELKRVIVASSRRVVMRETLGEALTALVAGQVPATVAGIEEGSPEAAEGQPTVALSEEVNSLVQQANEHYQAAEQARIDGDWGRYGDELDELQSTLQEMMELTGQELAPTPTPAPEAMEGSEDASSPETSP